MAKRKGQFRFGIPKDHLTRAIGRCRFRKLNPRTMMKNPVMFVVEVGSVFTTLLLIRGSLRRSGAPSIGFELQITLWLWFTVLFANFAEAMAEGRGKAQADNLRKAKTETTAHKLLPDGQTRNGTCAASCEKTIS